MQQYPKQIAEYLGIQLIQAHKAHRHQAEEAFNKLGIYPGQEMILLQLWNEDGLPQSQCAACSGVASHLHRAGRRRALRQPQDRHCEPPQDPGSPAGSEARGGCAKDPSIRRRA